MNEDIETYGDGQDAGQTVGLDAFAERLVQMVDDRLGRVAETIEERIGRIEQALAAGGSGQAPAANQHEDEDDPLQYLVDRIKAAIEPSIEERMAQQINSRFGAEASMLWVEKGLNELENHFASVPVVQQHVRGLIPELRAQLSLLSPDQVRTLVESGGLAQIASARAMQDIMAGKLPIDQLAQTLQPRDGTGGPVYAGLTPDEAEALRAYEGVTGRRVTPDEVEKMRREGLIGRR